MGRHSKAHRQRPAGQYAAAAAKAPAVAVKQTPAAAAAAPSQQPQHMQQPQQPQPQAQAKSTFPRQAGLPSPAAPPSNAHLAAHLQTLPALLESAYWTTVCPGLHCSDAADNTEAAGSRGAGTSGSSDMADTSKLPSMFDLPGGRLADLRQQVDHAGVAQVAAAELPWACSMQALALAVVQLLQHGWPPAFLVLFDEVWDMIQQMDAVMRHTTSNACNMDILAWYVDPNEGHSGFSPHRDRQPDDSPATFRADGSAMYTTAWIPFTDACPENSCLYVVPRYADPGYFEGDPEEEDAPDPLQRALHNKEAYQHIRALPAEAGAAVLFTHRIIHWGSQGRAGYHTPRISISYGCADDAFEAPYFSREHLPRPPLGLRLALAGAQMIAYHERFDMDARMLSLCHEAFRLRAHDFDTTYRRKVTSEFVAASKELAAKAAGGASARAAPRSTRQTGAAAPARGAGDKAKAAPTHTAQARKAELSKAAGKGVDAHAAVANGRGASAAVAPAAKRMRTETAASTANGKQQKRMKPQTSLQPQQTPAQQDEDEGDGGLELCDRDSSRDGSDDTDSSGAFLGADSDDSGGSDVLDQALDSMLDARMAGFHDDFEDDFEDDDVDGVGLATAPRSSTAPGFSGGSGEEEEDDDSAAVYDKYGLALGPGDMAGAADASGAGSDRLGKAGGQAGKARGHKKGLKGAAAAEGALLTGKAAGGKQRPDGTGSSNHSSRKTTKSSILRAKKTTATGSKVQRKHKQGL